MCVRACVRACVRMCVCVCVCVVVAVVVVVVIVKRPALPPCAVGGRFRNCLFSSSSLSNLFIPSACSMLDNATRSQKRSR